MLNEFAARNTGIKWRNAVDCDQLLSEPLDNVSYLLQSGGRTYLEKVLLPAETTRLAAGLERIVNEAFTQDGLGQTPKLVEEFARTLSKQTVKEKLRQQLSKGQTRKRIENVVNIAPQVFKGLLDEGQKARILALQAAQGIEKMWQDLADKAVDQALKQTASFHEPQAHQPDLEERK